jgi:hypothetical protein
MVHVAAQMNVLPHSVMEFVVSMEFAPLIPDGQEKIVSFSSENVCSLHGYVVLPGDKDSQLPYNYCSCDNGFTGIDCSTPVFSQGNVPWGTVFSGKEYTSKDKYEEGRFD